MAKVFLLPLCKQSSWLWKGICKAKSLVKKGACYHVHSGSIINIWEDPCIPSKPNFSPTLIRALPNGY